MKIYTKAIAKTVYVRSIKQIHKHFKHENKYLKVVDHFFVSKIRIRNVLIRCYTVVIFNKGFIKN